MKADFTQVVRLKWLLGQLLALLGLWTVSALDIALGPVLLGVALLTVFVTAFPNLPRRISPGIRKLIAPFLIVVFLGDMVMNYRDLIPPLVRLMLILLGIRVASFRSNREDLQLVLLAMFLSMVSGVFTLSMLFALQAFVFSMLSIGLLFMVNLLESSGRGAETDGDWDNFKWKEFRSYLRQSLNFQLVRSLLILLALLAVTTGILFVSIPRVYLDQAIPFLKISKEGLSGFSDTVRLGEVTSIKEDDSVAMWIDVPSIDAIPSDPYWRMLILDRYAEGTFINSLFYGSSSNQPVERAHTITPYPGEWFSKNEKSSGVWTFYLEDGVSKYLPILGPFREMRFQGRQSIQSDPDVFVFRLPIASNSVFFYQVTDFLTGPTVPGSEQDLRLNDGMPPESPLSPEEEQALVDEFENFGMAGILEENRYPFTTLSVPIEDREKEVLERINSEILNGEEEGPEQIASKILRYLQRHHSYSMSPGSFHLGDPVVQWLEEMRPGHCELFAAGFTLLARTAGVPTRMVVGFSGGSWNSIEDFFVVRNRQAHAWVEIFNGSDWVRFDPTPGGAGGNGSIAESLEGGGFLEESDFQAWIDSLRVMWYRRVINFDDSDQVDMIERLSGKVREIGTYLRELGRYLGEQARGWLSWFAQKLERFFIGVLGVLGGIALIVYLIRGTYMGTVRWGRDGPQNSLRRRARRELRRLEDCDVSSLEDEGRRLREELLAIRFGRHVELEHAKKVFREVRLYWKAKK